MPGVPVLLFFVCKHTNRNCPSWLGRFTSTSLSMRLSFFQAICNEVFDGDDLQVEFRGDFHQVRRRAIVPSSFMISTSTPAGLNPASRQVNGCFCMACSSTRRLFCTQGKNMPGTPRSSGLVAGSTRARIVFARSLARNPCRGTMANQIHGNGKGVSWEDVFRLTIISRCNSSHRSSVSEAQINPRPWVAIKLMTSGVTFSAAVIKSPSFSRLASSTTMTTLPALISAMASAMDPVSLYPS